MLNNTNSTAHYFFWKFIEAYKIKIPRIQRDYAQGRNNDKANSIRQQIIQGMINALSENKPLSLNFVYGYVVENEKTFIPIDGQQRLTTLWLLHVYLLKRYKLLRNENKNTAIENEPLDSAFINVGKFTYDTRKSSREFCQALTKEDILPESNSKNQVKEFVENQSWFYPDWAYDPTVAGMLRTLDEIHLQTNNKSPEKLLKTLLSENCPISFFFYNMKETGLTDDLYLLMNARGLPLTEYENFKASLEKYFTNDKYQQTLKEIVSYLTPKNKDDHTWENFADTPEKKIMWELEHDWYDVFWDTSKPDPIETENQILSVFRRHFLNQWSLTKGNDHENKQDIPTAFLSPSVEDLFFTPFSAYETVLNERKIKTVLEPVFNLFEALSLYNLNIETTSAWEETGQPLEGQWINKRETFKSRVLFFAVMKCFSKPVRDSASFREKYAEWMRIVWNILENTEIDNVGSYQSTLKLIDELGNHWDSILNWLKNPETKIKSKLAEEQVKEEREKAENFIIFQEAIIAAESVFKGAIRFLYRNGDGSNGWNNFEIKAKTASQYFTSESLNKNNDAAFISAFIKQVRVSFDGLQIFTTNFAYWKQLLLLKNNSEIFDTLFLSEGLSSIQIVDVAKDQIPVKTSLLKDGVITYLLENDFVKARFQWRDNETFRLYYPYYTKKHVLFDTDKGPRRGGKEYRRNKILVSCLENFDLTTKNTRIGDSNLFVGQDISVELADAINHPWHHKSWKLNWSNGDNTSSGGLVFDYQEQEKHFIVSITFSDSLEEITPCSVSLFQPEKENANSDWITTTTTLLAKQSYQIVNDESETKKYCVKDLSYEKAKILISTIINQPLKNS